MIPEGLRHLFAPRPWTQLGIDVLDLLVVTYVIYRALLVLRGTRAMQMGTGLGVIFLIYVGAKWAGLLTLYNVLSSLLSSAILIIVVVFQNDIRRGLMRVGARAFFAGMSRQQESRVIDEIVAAATELARHRMGALICFEQEANLDEFVVSQGTDVDAQVRRELLVGIFVPESVNKLHDGAVVIRNLRIAKAGVFFPMPDTKIVDKSLGSRHRAALGITEETDAVVVIVSEERGTIGLCFSGNIVSNLDGASLRQALLGLFGQRKKKKDKSPASRKGDKTGSYRISIPPPTPRMETPAADFIPRPSALPRLSSVPPAPSRRDDERSDRPDAPPMSKPLAPAKPIEQAKLVTPEPEPRRAIPEAAVKLATPAKAEPTPVAHEGDE
ncbi:MAG: TIGR00159 family protein [Myxococcales bacterium]|nr:TIGR00159 family protein [Myxococcales bacterium]